MHKHDACVHTMQKYRLSTSECKTWHSYSSDIILHYQALHINYTTSPGSPGLCVPTYMRYMNGHRLLVVLCGSHVSLLPHIFNILDYRFVTKHALNSEFKEFLAMRLGVELFRFFLLLSICLTLPTDHGILNL